MENRIGTAIKAKRKALGYTQEKLAEEVGKSPSFIGQIERGAALPSLETLAHLTQLLAIDANSYFYDNIDKNIESYEFYQMLGQLTPEMRKLSLEIIKLVYKTGKKSGRSRRFS